jgi:hypothetical protein
VFLGTLLVCLIGIIEFICSFVDNHDFLTQDFSKQKLNLLITYGVIFKAFLKALFPLNVIDSSTIFEA